MIRPWLFRRTSQSWKGRNKYLFWKAGFKTTKNLATSYWTRFWYRYSSTFILNYFPTLGLSWQWQCQWVVVMGEHCLPHKRISSSWYDVFQRETLALPWTRSHKFCQYQYWNDLTMTIDKGIGISQIKIRVRVFKIKWSLLKSFLKTARMDRTGSHSTLIFLK